MKTFQLSRERISLVLIVTLSALLNCVNLGIEGYSNQYYAAAVKSMLLNWKNFFFIALDPSGFVSVDKPPFGYWIQTVSARIFGFSGWSILLPQALAGVLSVIILYYLVKRSFGSRAGLISALCLAITPVFVAVSRNNTVDNQLVLALLLACWAVSIAAEKGNLRYLLLSMVLIGIGFNIKMLQAYMILPAIYTLYLLSNSISLPKRIAHLLVATVVLLAVSLSWALVVDSIPASQRPYIGCSSNNTVMELITGHNGAERLGGIFSIFTGNSKSAPGRGPGGDGAPPLVPNDNNRSFDQNNGDRFKPPARQDWQSYTQTHNRLQPEGTGVKMQMPGDNMPFPGAMNQAGQPPTSANNLAMRPPGGLGGNGPGGGGPGGRGGPGVNGGLAGTFGNQTPAGITRLFQRNVLSDQIVWFIPLALFGFLATAWRERLRLRLDDKRKQALALWFMWFLPVLIYFSYNTGLFHSYYLTMLAPPTAALAGIGLVAMGEMYKEGGWKSWLLPLALLANGAVQMLILFYFYSSTASIIKVLIGLLLALTLVPVFALMTLNLRALINKKQEADRTENEPRPGSIVKIALATLAVFGLMITPGAGSAAAMFKSVNSSMPGAGLELLPDKLWSNSDTNQSGEINRDRMNNPGRRADGNSDLIAFLKKHPVNGRAQVVVSSANTAESITLNSDVYVGSLSGFMGNQPVMSLARFQQLVKQGEVRYVLANSGDGRSGGPGGGNSEIMNWVQATGKLVSYSRSADNGGQVYDLSAYTRQANK